MKQVLLAQGKAHWRDVPAPPLEKGRVLVEVTHSLISAGTELSSLKGGDGNFLLRAIQKKENIEAGIKLVLTRGVQRTWATIQAAKDWETETGYSCAGRVLAVGEGVTDIFPGDRVCCAGASDAHHAELVTVPRNLLARIPDGVSLEDAACTTVGAIALQGVRRADSRLGERVAVMGLGLLGQLTVQLLVAAGVRVIGSDMDESRRARALEFGASAVYTPEQLPKAAVDFGNGRGVDAVIVTAATNYAGLLQEAMLAVRPKGRVVLVGAVPITFDRSPFYAKEVDFVISCSYGPGRYDAQYEQAGIDYPYHYVRWTENRNMQEFLALVGDGRVKMPALIDRQFPAAEVEQAYAALKSGAVKPLGVLLRFPAADEAAAKADPGAHRVNLPEPVPAERGAIGLAIVGAGSFVRAMHVPNILAMTELFHPTMIVNRTPASARHTAKQLLIGAAATDVAEILRDTATQAVLIGTRHNLHAEQSIAALKAGKAVLCEKPMAMTEAELVAVEAAAIESKRVYLVGFNRRFSPAAVAIGRLVAQRRAPLQMLCRIAAGHLPLDHWTQGEEGGGRLIGEGCHWIDLMQSFVGDDVEIEGFDLSFARPKERGHWWPRDNYTLTINWADGSVGSLVYTAMASKALAKELIEIHWGGESAVIDDFRDARHYPITGAVRSIATTPEQDKGHREELRRWGRAIRGEQPTPIPLHSLVRTTRLTIAANALFGDPDSVA